MSPKNTIQFKKERGLGDVISDTFGFVRQTYKDLFKVLYKVLGPVFIVLLAVIIGGYILVIKDVKNLFLLSEAALNTDIETRLATMILVGVLALVLLGTLVYSLLQGTVLYSIDSYMNNDGEIQVAEVVRKVKSRWGRLFILTIFSRTLMFMGIMTCFLPGVYLFVPMSLVFSSMVFRDDTIGGGIAQSFKLGNKKWMETFGVLFIMLIVIGIMNSIFQVPTYLYFYIRSLLSVMEVTDVDDSIVSILGWPFLILMIVNVIGSQLTRVFFIVSNALLYFNLNEKIYHSGAYDMIERLGSEN